MKVIAYINEPRELANVQSAVEWALSEPGLKSAGATHMDGRASFFQKLDSGTLVVHVQSSSPSREKEEA